jgi:hypothetical protein
MASERAAANELHAAGEGLQSAGSEREIHLQRPQMSAKEARAAGGMAWLRAAPSAAFELAAAVTGGRGPDMTKQSTENRL